MHLYAYLDKLGNRSVYYETDNVIFVQKDGESPLIYGEELRDMISELKENEYISEFVSGCSKTYAYEQCNCATGEKKAVCIVRGITLNYKASIS